MMAIPPRALKGTFIAYLKRGKNILENRGVI